MTALPARVRAGQHVGGHRGQSGRAIEFAAGEQSRVGGDPGP